MYLLAFLVNLCALLITWNLLLVHFGARKNRFCGQSIDARSVYCRLLGFRGIVRQVEHRCLTVCHRPSFKDKAPEARVEISKEQGLIAEWFSLLACLVAELSLFGLEHLSGSAWHRVALLCEFQLLDVLCAKQLV